MLVLAREVNESVILSGEMGKVTVKVLSVSRISRNRDGSHNAIIKLGFEAPKDVSINREEVQYAIERGEGPKHPK